MIIYNEITRRNDDHFALGAMETHSIERESETYLLSSMDMTKHFTAVQFYGRISQMKIKKKGL